VLDRIEVRDRRLAGVAYRAPFDALFGTGRFEYDAVVDPISQHANRILQVEGPTICL